MIASIVQDRNLQYPSKEHYFSPDEAFPEYPFQHISEKPNNVYRAIRECFIQAGLDKEHIGKASWNPLRYIISAGSSVFVLCNFVYHRRKSESQRDFFAKCTHASVIRAVIDYILLAVGKEGLVRFGNAPLQSCNWNQVLHDTGSSKVIEFYRFNSAAKVYAEDLRLYVRKENSTGAISSVEFREQSLGVQIDLAKNSLLNIFYATGNKPRFRVSDYNPVRTETFHAKDKHIYVLNKKILRADVIVSIPKLKTHEKVGITCGLKGCVGGIGQKDCLAHHRFGSSDIGGDEYSQNTFFLNWLSSAHDAINKKRIGYCNNAFRILEKVIRQLLRVIGVAQTGGWHGNNTAWRMTLDIARLLKYTAKSGELLEQPVRKHIMFTDGVIGGEGDGPLAPKPVASNFLSFCDDVVMGDYINCLAMGFDPDKIALIRESFTSMQYPLTNCNPVRKTLIFNNKSINLNSLPIHFDRRFLPPMHWRGHIELHSS